MNCGQQNFYDNLISLSLNYWLYYKEQVHQCQTSHKMWAIDFYSNNAYTKIDVFLEFEEPNKVYRYINFKNNYLFC